MSASPPYLDVAALRVYLPGTRHCDATPLLVDATLCVGEGEVVGLVGESGSGKTMLGLAVMGLLPAGAAVQAARMRLGHTDLCGLPEDEHRGLRGRSVAMVFQDPMTALNPYLRVRTQLAEMLPRGLRRAERRNRIARALAEVHLPDPARCAAAYPHELSGGMRQRVMIAMALLGEPRLLIADEPTTALDVTVQAQVLRLLAELVRDRGLALLLVSHDLAVVATIADRIVVMYAGETVEMGTANAIFASPAHPYTAALLASRPSAQARGRRLRSIPGAPAVASETRPGCSFAARCAFVVPACRQGSIPLQAAVHGGVVRCIRADEIAAPLSAEATLQTAAETPS